MHYRPYAGKYQESDIAAPEKYTSSDSDEVDAEYEQPLLFVHQTDWQQKLVRKYGNNIRLLDATYRTTRYALPLFFLAVKTNVDYEVVASFIVQHETADPIAEALNILKDWNPSWNPKFFMTDLSEQEINAVEEVFPGNVHCMGH